MLNLIISPGPEGAIDILGIGTMVKWTVSSSTFFCGAVFAIFGK
jgi:hypothetical protein